MINVFEVFNAEYKERVLYKDILLIKPIGTPVPVVPIIPNILQHTSIVAPGILVRTRAIINRIKTAPSYIPVKGQDMGIIGTAPSTRLAVTAPYRKRTPASVSGALPVPFSSRKGKHLLEIIKNGFQHFSEPHKGSCTCRSGLDESWRRLFDHYFRLGREDFVSAR